MCIQFQYNMYADLLPFVRSDCGLVDCHLALCCWERRKPLELVKISWPNPNAIKANGCVFEQDKLLALSVFEFRLEIVTCTEGEHLLKLSHVWASMSVLVLVRDPWFWLWRQAPFTNYYWWINSLPSKAIPFLQELKLYRWVCPCKVIVRSVARQRYIEECAQTVCDL